MGVTVTTTETLTTTYHYEDDDLSFDYTLDERGTFVSLTGPKETALTLDRLVANLKAPVLEAAAKKEGAARKARLAKLVAGDDIYAFLDKGLVEGRPPVRVEAAHRGRGTGRGWNVTDLRDGTKVQDVYIHQFSDDQLRIYRELQHDREAVQRRIDAVEATATPVQPELVGTADVGETITVTTFWHIKDGERTRYPDRKNPEPREVVGVHEVTFDPATGLFASEGDEAYRLGELVDMIAEYDHPDRGKASGSLYKIAQGEWNVGVGPPDGVLVDSFDVDLYRQLHKDLNAIEAQLRELRSLTIVETPTDSEEE